MQNAVLGTKRVIMKMPETFTHLPQSTAHTIKCRQLEACWNLPALTVRVILTVDDGFPLGLRCSAADESGGDGTASHGERARLSPRAALLPVRWTFVEGYSSFP